MPDDERPKWLDDHDILIELRAEVRAMKEAADKTERTILSAVGDANTICGKDRANLWAEVGHLRRNGGWKGKSIQIGIPTTVASALTGALMYLLTGKTPAPAPTIERPPVMAVVPSGRMATRAVP